MRDDDPQVEHMKMMMALNSPPPPAYYPKAVLKSAIGELVKALEMASPHIDPVAHPFTKRHIQGMIDKHSGKQG